MSRARPALCSLFLLIILIATNAIASPPRSADSPIQVFGLYASTDAWATDILATSSDGATLHFGNCFAGLPGTQITLAPGETKRVENYGRNECGESIGLAPLSVEGGSAMAIVVARFKDADGNVASFVVPPLVNHLPDQLSGDFIQNDETFDTYLALFNLGSHDATVTATIYDSSGAPIGKEYFETSAGKLTFAPLVTSVGIGRIELREGSGVGCGYCSTDQPIYVIALVNWRAGGSARVVEFFPTN